MRALPGAPYACPGTSPAPPKPSAGAAFGARVWGFQVISNQSDPAGHWGPWAPIATDRERLCSTVALRLLASIILGRPHPLVRALRCAEDAGDDAMGARAEALAEAAQELERLPALTRRRLLCSYGACIRKYPDAVRRGRPTGRYEKAERRGAA